MNKISSKRFDETLYLETLESGLNVILVHKPEFRNSVAVLGTNFGGKHLHQKVNNQVMSFHSGVAHFLEHKLFEKPDVDILSVFTTMGASANAFTSYNETVYYFSTSQNIEKPLNTLLDFVLDLDISETGVQKEKGIILEELKMYQEMPYFRLSMEMLESLFHNHPLKYDIAGSKESIQAISKSELETVYSINYHPSQLVLSIVSPVHPDNLLKMIKSNISLKQFETAIEVENILSDEPVEVNRSYVEIDMKVNVSKYALAFKQNLKFQSLKEMYKANLLAQMLLDLNFSKLNPQYQEWSDQGLINDIFVYQSDFGMDYGYIEFIAETNKTSELKELILQQFNELKVSDDKVKQLKKRYLGEAISDFSDFESFAINNFRAFWLQSNQFDLIEVIDSITPQDLLQFIQSLNFENISEVLIKK